MDGRVGHGAVRRGGFIGIKEVKLVHGLIISLKFRLEKFAMLT